MKQSTPQSTTVPRYSSLQITTTPRGRAVPIVYGANKVTSDIVWAADFHNVPYKSNSGHSSGKGMGGGGGGGKGGGGGSTQYYYFASLLGALCEGPIYAFVAARNGSNWVYFNGNSPSFAWPVTSQWPSASPGTIAYEGYPLLASIGATGVPGQNLLPYEVATLTSSLYIGYEESGMVDDLNAVNPSRNKGFKQAGTDWQNIGPNSWASQAFMLMPGYSRQPYPPYIGSRHPGQIDSYQYTAYWFCPNYQLGQQATPPTLDWFIVGLLPYDPTGASAGVPIVDAEPVAVITDLLTNPVRGAAVPISFLDPITLTNYQTYCIASGLFLSCVLSSQIEVSQIVNLIMQQTVSVCFWSEGLFKAVPWYDQSVTGHGKTFTPNLTPVYTVNDNHLLDQKNAGPVECQRSSVFDTFNQLNVNFNNRALNYSTDTITVDDQASQIVWGVRPAPPAMAQYIADASVAAASAQLQLSQLLYERNTYTFSLLSIFCLLEPMDILLLNDAGMGIVNFPVRVQQISLNNNDEYQVTAQNIVDELFGVQARNQQVSLGSGLPGSVPPGPVFANFIFTGPTRITGQSLEIWIAVAGIQQGWGGCNIWMSTDGTTYEKVGVQWAGSRYGAIYLPLPPYVGTNPDGTDVVYLNMVGPNQQLSSVSAAQAAQGLTLALIQTGSNFELLSYQTATLIGTNQAGNLYALSGLYRGLAGSFGIGHNAGDLFARLDDNIAKIPLNVAMVGQTVYFKFCSFNMMGGMTESLSQVTAYPYTILSGTSSPVGVTSLTVMSNGQFTVLTWNADNSPEVVGYQIRYGIVGQNFQQAKPVINEISSTHTVSLIMPPGQWVFYVASYDKLGQFSSTIQSQTFTVPNLQLLFVEENFGALVHGLDPGATQIPDWGRANATLTNCFVHPTAYELCTTDGSLASFSGADNGWEWVDQYCITPPAAGCTYVSPAINIGPGQTNIRGSAQLYEFLWGLPLSTTPSGIQTVRNLNPDWNLTGTVLVNCFAHPTAWTIVPTDTLAASYSGADNGWEVFDFTVYSPPATSTVTYVIDAGAIYPVQAVMQTSTKPSPGGSVPVMTASLTHSGDNSHFVTLGSLNGAGQINGLAVDRYFQFQVQLNNSAGQATSYPLAPDWSGVVLTNALVHPTAYVVCPADSILASFSGADNGFEVFDNYVYAPFASSSVTFVADAGSVTTVKAALNSSLGAGPNQTLAPPSSGLYNASIGYANSPGGPFTTLVSGDATGVLNGTVSARYFQFSVTLTNQRGNLVEIAAMTPTVTVLTPTSGGIGTLNSLMAEIIVGPPQYWTPVVPQIRTSPDGVTWGPYQQVPSTFTVQQYIQFQFQWNIIGALWPFGISSVWMLADGTPLNQSGSVTTSAGTAAVTFATPYRQVPTVTCTVQGSSSIVAAVVSAATTGFTVDTFTSSTGAAANATLNWSATGI